MAGRAPEPAGQRLGPSVPRTDIADERRNADIGGNIPKPDRHPGGVVKTQQITAGPIRYRRLYQPAPGTFSDPAGPPYRDRIALDHLANRRNQGLRPSVPSAQPIR